MKLNTSVVATSLTLALAGVLSACGAAAGPSSQLVTARYNFEQARTAPGAELVPDRVLAARQALMRAERIHAEEPGSAAERHYAYLASRKAGLAMAHGELALAERSEALADRRYNELQNEMRLRAQQKLRDARSQLATTRVSLEKEHQARIDAEKSAAAALESLKEFATVRADQQETIITLTGEVLFRVGESQLIPTARRSLELVAEAIKQQDENKAIIVEGHADSRGSDAMNQELSEARARAVQQFLIDHGLNGRNIQAVGRGESEPIANNATPEGRANNRRVEIIIKNSAPSTTP